MKKNWKVFVHMTGGLAIAAVFVAVIMWLWNLIIPSVTGWASINYWQALGLTILCHLLTGHMWMPMHGRGKRPHSHKMPYGMSIKDKKTFIRERLKRWSDEEVGNEQ